MDKQAVREAVWDAVEERGVARFPFPPHDLIPNFAGADAARDSLTDTEAWATATTLKCNPDAPQLPVRRAALRAGKTVYVAQPRLRDADPFLRLDPEDFADADAGGDATSDAPTVDDATTVSGISTHGTPVPPEDVPIDLVVTPERTIQTNTPYGRPAGIDWEALNDEKLDAMPVLAERAPGRE